MLQTGPTELDTVFVAATAQFAGGGAFDLASLVDVKLELNIDSTTDDVWLRQQIKRASAAINRYCNRPLNRQTYAERYWPFHDAYPWQSPSRTAPLQLHCWPISAAPSPAGIAPPHAPMLDAVEGGAGSPARYYVRISYVTAAGETAASEETVLAVAAGSWLTVATPGPDRWRRATGWNLYVGTSSGAETLQNSGPLALSGGWTQSGPLATVSPPPSYVLVVEHAEPPSRPEPAGRAMPLAEGLDFMVDARRGQVVRLFADGMSRSWSGLPLFVIYPAGYAEIPDDIQEAAILLVKMRWFARRRDPLIRSQNAPGVWEATYVMGTGPGGADDMPAEVTALIDRYRVPVIA